MTRPWRSILAILILLGMFAVATDRTVSDMVNEAVKIALSNDADDLAVFSIRKNEKSLSFDTFVQGLKRRGSI